MKLKDIFLKQYDRHIEGVIKADSTETILNEVEEFVVTKEIRKNLGQIKEAYLAEKAGNGVWISGFFGSGKSHLLKMLAVLMENQSANGKNLLDIFLSKIDDDLFLRNDFEKMCLMPSKSILFNISQQVNVKQTSQEQAMIDTFVRVFNEMNGYFGKQGHIAQFERDLDRRGLFGKFKDEYKKIAEISWEEGREQSLFEEDNIEAAYAKITNSNSDGIIQRYEENYTMAIGDFADLVNEYIEAQEKGFRLNFFIDEVGQFIANDSRTILALQTVVESLATRCKGRAWVFVTAQEKLDKIVGRMSQSAGQEISRIQDRFKLKVNLSSANVDEVIRLRLLEKNGDGEDQLGSLYIKEQNNLKTLFDLPDGAKVYKNFVDRDHFVSSYPFIPYQYALFQSVMHNLSDQGAFTGAYQSIGERSMLEVFQDVVINISDYEVGKLATFDSMYDQISKTLMTTIKFGITQSEGQIVVDDFSKKVLKILFLVKYVKEFKATISNIAVLLIDNFSVDLVELRNKVEESLIKLEHQAIIKRYENVYEYLTDKERDIENEIRRVDVDQQSLNKYMAELFYNHIAPLSKMRYEANNRDFSITRKLNNYISGKSYEVGIHIVTEDFDEGTLSARSIEYDNEMFVSLASDSDFYKEAQHYIQTTNFIRQSNSNSRTPEEQLIINSKAHKNQKLNNKLRADALNLLSSGDIYVKGDRLTSISSDAKLRVFQGFQRLIENVYINLEQLGAKSFDEKDIPKYLEMGKENANNFFNELDSAENTIMQFINMRKMHGQNTTLKALAENFEQRPNGWPLVALLALLAKLYGMGKIEMNVGSTPINDDDFEKTVRNTANHSSIIVSEIEEISSAEIKSLRTVFNNAFHTPPKSSDAKGLATNFSEMIKEKLYTVNEHYILEENYPFLSQLKPVIELLKLLKDKKYEWYYKNLSLFEKELPNLIEDVADPIFHFMGGNQKEIYTKAKNFLVTNDTNLRYLEGEETGKLIDSLNDPDCFRNSRMIKVKELHEFLEKKLGRELEKIKKSSKEKIEELKNKLEKENKFKEFPIEKQNEMLLNFNYIENLITTSTDFAFIKDRVNKFEDDDYQAILMSLISPPVGEGDDQKALLISIKQLNVSYPKSFLDSKEDVENYVEKLKEALLAELAEGKNIQV